MLIEEPSDDRTDTSDDPVETPQVEVPADQPEGPAADEPTAPEATADATPVTEGEDEAPAAAVPEGNGQVEAEAAPAGADPFGGPGDWYVIHTYAGYENKVKTNLESRIHTMQMEEKIFDVHVPMEDVMEIKGGKKQVVQKKVFPGYLLVRMVYDDDSWYVVRNTPGVTGFVSSGTGQKPTPLSRREVEKILAVKEEEAKKPAFRLEFEEGDVVRIISGPFADFNGTISDINVDQSKLRVMVNIFDRETPVELGFDQVAKV
jgi:transcription termination/antitermination protein NusG